MCLYYGMTITIRSASINDIDWVVLELKRFSEFFGTKKELFSDKNYARAGCLILIKGHVLYLAENESERIGFIAGLLTPHLFNPSIKILTELFWWVTEEHRGSRAGSLLLGEFVDYGKRHADWIAFGLRNNTRVRDETLLNYGFQAYERSFLLEV